MSGSDETYCEIELKYDDGKCSSQYDDAEIERAIDLFCDPDGVHELRALGVDGAGIVSGYYDASHRDDFVADAAGLSGDAYGVYFTLNPVDGKLHSRSYNQCRGRARNTSSDADVVRRRFLPIDFDPVRPSGISSSEAEHVAAIRRASDCRDFLVSLGIPEDALILADSGNGAHLVCRIDVPNDATGRDLVKKCIDAVAARFTDAVVNVDQSTFNAARIWKLPGTLACKGDSTPDRPHRLARLLDVPSEVVVTPKEQLLQLAAFAPPAIEPGLGVYEGTRASFDIDAWLVKHRVPVSAWKSWQQGRLWTMPVCPWNPQHTNGSAFVVQAAGGALAARCHHASCQGKGWHELRDVYEPGWRSKRKGSAADVKRAAKPIPMTERIITLTGTPSAKLKVNDHERT